jgi:hypothetical protein
VLEGEIGPLSVGSLVHCDIEVWDATWTASDARVPGISVVETDQAGRPVSNVIGIARLAADQAMDGFFVAAGDVWVWAYTGEYESTQGMVPPRPVPDHGAWVGLRGTLGVVPAYVAESTFDPMRAAAPGQGSTVPGDRWLILEAVLQPSGDWIVNLESASDSA